MKSPERPGFFGSLLERLQEKKWREGRPHWIVIDLAEEVMSEAALTAVSILAVCGPVQRIEAVSKR